jgi:hypothetical protein
LNVRAVAPVRFVPVITTTVPATPDVGAKAEMVGIAGGGGSLEAALPQAAITSKKAAETNAAAKRRVRLEGLMSRKTLLAKDNPSRDKKASGG